MKKLYYAALAYAILGLTSGMFYRGYTEANDFTGDTQLAVLHTHLLTMGMLVMLSALALEKIFSLSKNKWFNLFYWHYNGGFLLMIVIMMLIGMQQVAGHETTPMLAGLSGTGHILVTLGVGFLFVSLGKRLNVKI